MCTCLVCDAVPDYPPHPPASPTHCFLQQWHLCVPSCYSTCPRGPVTPQPPSHLRPAVPSRSLRGLTGRLALLSGDTLSSGETWAVLVEPRIPNDRHPFLWSFPLLVPFRPPFGRGSSCLVFQSSGYFSASLAMELEFWFLVPLTVFP